MKHLCVKYPIKLQLSAIAKVGRLRGGKLNTKLYKGNLLKKQLRSTMSSIIKGGEILLKISLKSCMTESECKIKSLFKV